MKKPNSNYYKDYDYFWPSDRKEDYNGYSIRSDFYNKCKENSNSIIFYLSLKDTTEKKIYKAIMEGKVEKYE